MEHEDSYDDGAGIVVEERTHVRTRRPRMFRVLMHNDDYTTRDFVVYVLQSVFHHPEAEALRVMLHVHHNGVGVAGVFSREIAETKIRKVQRLASENEFPLRLSMEPESGSDEEEPS